MDSSYISRKEQAQLTKKKIFDTTLLLIKKKGFGKITIREICQSAQISIGTFYLYFSSKDEILLEIYNKIDQKVKFPPAKDADGAISDITEAFSIYLNCMIEMFDKELLREIYRTSLVSGENAFVSSQRPLFQAVLAALNLLQDHFLETGDSSCESLCFKLHIFVQSYIFQWLVDDSLPPDFLTEGCMQELERYLSLYLDR